MTTHRAHAPSRPLLNKVPEDLEVGWDNAEGRLRPEDRHTLTTIDGEIDKVLRELRATSPNPDIEKTALTALLNMLG